MSENLDVKIFPNPITDFGTITFKNYVNDANVNISLYDVLGRKIGTYFDKQMNTGDADYFQLEASKFSAGIYNLVFRINGKQMLSKQLVIAK
jgi:hypothetical protein